MDRAKGIMKNGWKPEGDPSISRKTWKSDIKGMVPGSKKKDPYEDARNHQSAALSTLKDPDSFGPPPKHSTYYSSNGDALNPVTPAQSRIGAGPMSYTNLPPRHTGGLGAPAVETGYAQRKQREMEQREAQEQAELNRQKAQPYQRDTSGLRTDNLPPPPKRAGIGMTSPAGSTAGRSSPALPPRVPARQTTGTLPAPASRQNTASTTASRIDGPAPFLPPRQNEYPDENTPPAPPSYGEALSAPQPPQSQYANAAQGAAQRFSAAAANSWQQRQQQNQDPAAINQGAASRLGQAGVSIPGFGIGANNHTSSAPIPSAQQMHTAASFAQGAASRFGQSTQSQTGGAASHGGQLSELQQRFSRMNTGAQNDTVTASPAGLAAAAQKKAPPPPPPKKAGIAAPQSSDASGSAPPPVPMGSKPRP